MAKPRIARALSFLVPAPGPQRVYGLAMLVNQFGFGLIFTAMTLYFTRVVHLSTGQVGLGLTIAGLIGLLAGIPVGDFADRYGPREMVRGILLVQFVVTACYVFIHSFAAFLAVASLETLSFGAYAAANGALMRRVGGDSAAAFRSVTRAIGNLGVSLGALCCGVAVVIGTADAYKSLIILNALTFLAAWAVLGRVPRYEPLPKPESGPRWVALSDKPFVAYAALAGAMSMMYWVISGPLPLWVVNHTSAPRWSVPGFLIVNTALVILLQVRVGRKVETVRQGGTGMLRAGVIFLVSLSAIGLATGIPGWAALLLLVAAVTLYTFGELWFAASSFAIDFGLAPAHAQGQYQGLVGIGFGAGTAAAPLLMIGLALSFGRAGWVGLGVMFCLLGMLGPAVARWGERTRPRSAEVIDAAAPVVTSD